MEHRGINIKYKTELERTRIEWKTCTDVTFDMICWTQKHLIIITDYVDCEILLVF